MLLLKINFHQLAQFASPNSAVDSMACFRSITHNQQTPQSYHLPYSLYMEKDICCAAQLAGKVGLDEFTMQNFKELFPFSLVERRNGQ